MNRSSVSSILPFALGVGFGICVAVVAFVALNHSRQRIEDDSTSEKKPTPSPKKANAQPSNGASRPTKPKETTKERIERLKNVKLAPLCHPGLNKAMIFKWRRQYRNFRLGDHSGADGIPDLSDDDEDMPTQTTAQSPSVQSPNSSNVTLSRPIFEVTSTADEMESAQNEINEYRLAYRNHRSGAARGAKGEIKDLTAGFSISQLRMLPVSQIAGLKSGKTEFERDQKEHEKKTSVNPPKVDVTPVHVHFGAGRLGSGLLIPAIAAKDSPFVIVQRPVAEFDPLIENAMKGDRKVRLLNNGGEYENNELVVVRHQADVPPDWEAWVNGDPTHKPSPRGVLLYCDTTDPVAQFFYSHASSFSTSVGPGMKFLGKMLNSDIIPRGKEPEHRPALFAGENDHDGVDALKAELAGRVTVVHLMVDRICTDRKLIPDTKEINTSTEPYKGAIVVLTPPVYATSPFAGDHVLIPHTEAEASYLCRRKLLLVNGMHTTLAFLTLGHKVPLTEILELNNDKLPAPYSDLTLITLKDADATQAKFIRAWAVARLLLLLYEYDLEVIKSAHQVQSDDEVLDILWEYSEQTLLRFNTIDDSCGRVLGGGVTNRFKGRLAPVANFFRQKGPLTPLQKRILARGGLSVRDVKVMVQNLTTSAYRFTEMDIQLDVE